MDNDVDSAFAQDAAMVQDFLVECEELLQGMDQDMVQMESTPDDQELLNRVFRALHTIKGTSGFLGFEPIVRLGHRAEDLLNDLRRGEVKSSRRLMNALLATRDCLGGMLSDIRSGGLKSYDLDELLNELKACQNADPRDSQPDALASGKSQEIAPAPLPVETSITAQSASSDASQTMRVDVRKLDDLINLVGELVLERNRLTRLASDLTLGRIQPEELGSALTQSTGRLSFITEELQSVGLRARMVPIDAVFRKFPRLVRDVANTLHKEVNLQISGKETEVDKTVVELIADPLVHLVRNSLDHGLELPEVRVANGKNRQGNITLEARQEGDQILVSVSDNGAGIDPERILRKAVEKGLVSVERGRALSKREVLDFVFLPGFSTAEKVNDLSGRGVGMDVVRSNLKRMNGTIELHTELGSGTTVMLRLPLTLAILPALLVEAAGEVYGLPLRSVIETSQIQQKEVHNVEGQEVLRLRGNTLPLLRLRTIFPNSRNREPMKDDKVVVLAIGQQRLALAVDRLLGQESTVIKPLGSYLHNCAGIAGATVSGDGRVRLVLDPAGLLAAASQKALSVIQP